MAAETKLKIHRIDDETVDISYGHFKLAHLTHDEHGWSGMTTIESALRNFAKAVGAEIEEIEGEES